MLFYLHGYALSIALCSRRLFTGGMSRLEATTRSFSAAHPLHVETNTESARPSIAEPEPVIHGLAAETPGRGGSRLRVAAQPQL